MTPEEIRALFAAERAATEAEAAATEAEARHDPEIARALWATVVALAPSEFSAAAVLALAVGDLIIALISERVASDDAWALRAAAAVVTAQHRTSRPPRGKPRNAKTA